MTPGSDLVTREGTKRGDAQKNVEFEEPVCILVALTHQHRISERLEKGMSRR